MPQEFALPPKADAAPAPAAAGGDSAAAAKVPGKKQVHEKLREPIEPDGGYPVGDPRKEWAESLRHAIMDKKRAKREDKAGQSFKSQNEMGWAPQLSGSKLDQQQDLRARLKSDPSSLSAVEKERAELLVARDERKAEKKTKRAEHRARRDAANGIVPASDADKSLAKKWGFSEKMAAAAAARLKKGLKRGDWECPKCKNNNFARRDKCLKCDEPVPTEHSRWASLGSKEFEDHDAKYWEDKQKEVRFDVVWVTFGALFGAFSSLLTFVLVSKFAPQHLAATAETDGEKSDLAASEVKGTLWDCKKCGVSSQAICCCL